MNTVGWDALRAFEELSALENEALEKARAYADLKRDEAARLFAALAAGKPPEQKKEIFAALCGGIGGLDRAAFALRVAEDCGDALPDGVFEGAKGLPSSLLLPQGRNDGALKTALVRRFGNVKFLEASGFEDACVRAADGEADGCVLPLADSDGRPLESVDRLAREYGQKKQWRLRLGGDEDGARFGVFLSALRPVAGASRMELTVYGGAGHEDVLRALFPDFDAVRRGSVRRFAVKGEQTSLLYALRALCLLDGEFSLEGFYEDFIS